MNRRATLRATLFGSVATVALLATPAVAETEVKVGGYIKGDLIYNVDEDVGDTFVAAAIAIDGSLADSQSGSFRAHGKQSRFWIKTTTPTEMGKLKTHIESDFFGAGGNETFSNSTAFRFRHAYGQIGGLLIGQTWTNFMSLHASADTVDFSGPTGGSFIRAPQIRYTFTPSDNLAIAFSVENPELTGRFDAASAGGVISSENPASDSQAGLDTLPDFVGSVKYKGDRVTARASAVYRRLELEEDPVGLGAVSGASATGWGVNGSLSVKPFSGDKLMLKVLYGEGLGRYHVGGFANGLFVDTVTGTVTAPAMLGLGGGYQHAWNDKAKSTLAVGYTNFSDTFDTGDLETILTTHLNLWYAPFDGARFGFEVIYGAIERNDGTEGDATRLQFGAQYSF